MDKPFDPVIRPATRVNKADNISQPEQLGVPVLAADVNGKLLKEKELRALDKHIKQTTEQPNTELLIVKTIQGLISAVNRELGKLDELTVPKNNRKVFIRQVLDDIDILQRGPLNELQKAFE